MSKLALYLPEYHPGFFVDFPYGHSRSPAMQIKAVAFLFLFLEFSSQNTDIC